MLKDEWLEYFEAVNGRKPRPIDFKEALERGEFVLSEGAEANQVADQGETSADQQFEEETATARALAQSQKERDNAQEAMANATQEKRKALSQETVGQVRTIQSGRQAEDIQKEEEQRKLKEVKWQQELDEGKKKFLDGEYIPADIFLEITKRDGFEIHIRTKGTFNRHVNELDKSGCIRYCKQRGCRTPDFSGCHKAIAAYLTYLESITEK